MKFVKENMTLVICGVVVLLMIGLAFYMSGPAIGSVASLAGERYSTGSKNAQTVMNMPLDIPGVEQKGKGVPTENYRSAKNAVNKAMADQAALVVKMGGELNRGQRVTIGKDNHVTPLLNGKEQKDFLPKIQRDKGAEPEAFKEDYRNVFVGEKSFAALLIGPGSQIGSPRELTLQAEWTERNARRAGMPGGAPPMAPGGEQQAFADFQRGRLNDLASKVRMYVEPDAFQVRGWRDSDVPPNEQAIFEALVDTWIQTDVVRAVAATNELASANAAEKNVGSAAVKRLIRVAVGNDALASLMGQSGGQQNSAGSLFYMGGQVGGQNTAAAAANTIDLNRNMTGRASGTDYDVVMLRINVDIDPTQINKFIDQLYRTNMGYTVLSINTKTIDPLDRAGSGYLYGPTQAVEAEFLVESLLFRTWTQPLMPTPIRVSLGLPPEPEQPAAQ
jgi:hypothetical protein